MSICCSLLLALLFNKTSQALDAGKVSNDGRFFPCPLVLGGDLFINQLNLLHKLAKPKVAFKLKKLLPVVDQCSSDGRGADFPGGKGGIC